MAARSRSNGDKIDEIFMMAFQTDFSENEYGRILKAAYENDQNPQLLQILESYMSHNDYLQLKNELSDFAKARRENDAEAASDLFRSLPSAIDFFVQDGSFTDEEGQYLKQLYEQKHRQLASIWRVYEVIKKEDDMLHSLKVFMEIKMKQKRAANEGGAGASQEKEAPSNKPEPL